MEPPVRRKRYPGTHPRRLEEKYKELRGDPEALARAEARGQTPAGRHRPILLDPILAWLDPQPGQILVDCTLGGGGHAAALAERLAPGRLIALDLDKAELARTMARLEPQELPITAHAMNFAGLPKVLEAEGLRGVDGLLADLGVSSMQLDRPERGFSLKNDGPLDMRLDASRGQPASEWLARQTVEGLAELLMAYGDEPAALPIAEAVVEAFHGKRPPRSTRALAGLVARALGLDPATRQASAFKAHPAARTFQAIRMAVNREPDNLTALLRVLPAHVLPGGRVAFLTFHSGEERLMKAALTEPRWEAITLDLRPSADEVASNPRARSARLQVARRALDAHAATA